MLNNIQPIISLAFILGLFAIVLNGATNIDARHSTTDNQINNELSVTMGVSSNQVRALLQKEQVMWQELSANIASSQWEYVSTNLASLAGILIGNTGATQGVSNVTQKGCLPIMLIDMLSGRNHGNNDRHRIDKAGFMGIPLVKCAEQQFLAGAIRRISREHPELLFEILNLRANSSISTAGDVIVYQSVLDGLAENRDLANTGSELEPKRNFPHADALLSLAKSTNPVYRLLIFSLLPILTKNNAEMINGLNLFDDETDPTIRKAVFEKFRLINSIPEKRKVAEGN